MLPDIRRLGSIFGIKTVLQGSWGCFRALKGLVDPFAPHKRSWIDLAVCHGLEGGERVVPRLVGFFECPSKWRRSRDTSRSRGGRDCRNCGLAPRFLRSYSHLALIELQIKRTTGSRA
jgi:hypothetical protein